ETAPYRAEARIGTQPCNSLLRATGQRQRAEYRTSASSEVDALDISQRPLHTGRRRCERKQLSAETTESLRSNIEPNNWQQLVGVHQDRECALRRDREKPTAMAVGRFPIVVHQDRVAARKHEERIVELARRDQNFRAKTELGLDGRWCEERIAYNLRFMPLR